MMMFKNTFKNFPSHPPLAWQQMNLPYTFNTRPLTPEKEQQVSGIKGGVYRRTPEGVRSLGSLDFQTVCEAHSGLVPSG
jgi:hypothetical protein